jgi:hypothetical protein
MMGQHSRSEALFYYFRLEDQVPETHRYSTSVSGPREEALNGSRITSARRPSGSCPSRGKASGKGVSSDGSRYPLFNQPSP